MKKVSSKIRFSDNPTERLFSDKEIAELERRLNGREAHNGEKPNKETEK